MDMNTKSWIDNSQSQSVDCQEKLIEDVFVCVSNFDIDFNKFLIMVGTSEKEEESSSNSTDSSNGTIAEHEAFRDKVCSVQSEVMTCVFDAATVLIKKPACAYSARSQGSSFDKDLLLNDQRYLIKEQVESIIGQYDVYCALPCRISLLDDMRKCYEDAELDSKLFLSHESGGAVIGSDSWEVESFCKNREDVVGCLMRTREDCPESDLVLSAVGLDLEFMAKGFSVLCEEEETYLMSLECFASHTPEVGYCASIKHREVIKIATEAHAQRWTSEQYFKEICSIRLKHIQCDMDAWTLKEDENCDEATFSLKRKLHCSLIPKQCESSEVMKFCAPSRSWAAATHTPSLLLALTAALLLTDSMFLEIGDP